jgi:hypothetical protein
MRKPVISSEIRPKLDGVPTTDFLPLPQLTENIVCQTHITLFSVPSTPEIYSRYTHPLDSIFLIEYFNFEQCKNEKLNNKTISLRRPVIS